MEKPFLIPTSTVFEGADLIDCIRQSYIDLNEDSDGELVEDLIKDSVEKLCVDLSYEVAIEIIALLSKCFSVLSTDPMPFLNTLFDKSKQNSYLMYSFISALSYLINNKPELDFTPYHSFINDSIIEIKPQIKNNDSLVISGLEIPLQFRAKLILNLLLCPNLTEQLFDDFSYVFTTDFFSINTKLETLIHKVTDNGFSIKLLSLLLEDRDNKNIDQEIYVENETKQGKYDTPKFEDPLFDEFLNDPNVEENEIIKKKLIKKMLTDKFNLLCYFQIIFENLNKLKIEPSYLLEYFYEEYQMSPDDFVKILDNVYILHPIEKVFIPQPKYKPLNFQESEFNNEIITKLYDIIEKDPGHFQAFYCLECIANSFPFIFQFNPQKVFESVLPAFDNYKIIYDEKTSDDDEQEISKIRKGKSALAAISFLQFSLNSTKVFDEFVQWFFKNINNLSLSQLLCIFIVFLEIPANDFLKHLATLFIKNNIFEACSDILLRKVPDNLFGLNFNYFMYTLFEVNKKLETVLSPFDTLTIDANKNEENIFYKGSGYRITHSFDCLYPHGRNNFIYYKGERILRIKKEFIIFINRNEDFKPTWTTLDRIKKDLPEKVDELFIDIYKKIIPQQQENSSDDEIKIPEIPKYITCDQIRKFINKENWIIQYVLLQNKFPLLSEHKKIIVELINDVIQIDESITDEDDERLFRNFSMNKYFKSYREGQTFLHNLINRMITSNIQPLAQLSNFVNLIPFDENDYDIIMNTIWKNLNYIDQNYSYTQESTLFMIRVNLLFLASFVCVQMKSKSVDKDDFTNVFFEKIGNNIINFILKPYYRSNSIILEIIYKMLSFFERYPIRVLHIIAFMFLTEDKYIQKCASSLCSGLEEKQLNSLTLLDDVFRNELDSPNPQLIILSNILSSNKSIGLAYKGSLLILLESLLKKFQKIKNGDDEEEENEDDDIKMKYFIIELLDFLSPERDENRSFKLSDSLIASMQTQKYRFCPIPDFIINTAPNFWKVFDEYRPLINEILLKEFQENEMIEIPGIAGIIYKQFLTKNFSSRFVSNYPECFSFEFRSTFFKQMQHDEISFIEDLELEFDMVNLYESSYKQLSTKSPNDWKYKFTIKYNNVGNEGMDESGLTKDWFTKITREIFSPKRDLFEMSEKNQNYSPSRSIVAQSEEGLKRLKFAGMIIARALMQGFLVPIHLSKPFLKQILHHEETIKPEDLEDVNEELFIQMNKIKNYDFDKLDLDFRFEVDFEGKRTELIQNGSEIRVDNNNKEEFVKLRSLYHMISAIRKQVDAFCDGFDSLIPHEKIRMFTPTELCLLICGVPKIDVDDLRNNVVIEEPYDANSPVINLFFNTIKKWDDENLAKLLIFITGTARMPSNGFVYYNQIRKPITIQAGGDHTRLPVAHTCVNTLDLPEYQNEEEMNSKLLLAIKVQDFQVK